MVCLEAEVAGIKKKEGPRRCFRYPPRENQKKQIRYGFLVYFLPSFFFRDVFFDIREKRLASLAQLVTRCGILYRRGVLSVRAGDASRALQVANRTMSNGGSRGRDVPVHRRDSSEGIVLRERRNWRIFSTFARQEYPECLAIIEEQLRACNGLAEYPIYVKGKCRM